MTYERMKGPAHSRDKHDQAIYHFSQGLDSVCVTLVPVMSRLVSRGTGQPESRRGAGHTGHTP